MSETPFDALAHPDRLNLGCGFDLRPGYLNVDFQDFHGPDLVADVTDLSMLPAGRYAEIVAQDVLEHLPRIETQAVLGEWNRLLALDGVLVLRIPSIVDLAVLLQAPENQEPARQELFVQCLFGTQAYTGDVHLTGFTRPLLAHWFEEEGFHVDRWEVRDGWLFDVQLHKVGPSRFLADHAADADLLRHHDVETFLRAAYDRLLGRQPDPSGAYHYGTQLTNGALTRRGLIRVLADSDEARARAGS